MELRLENIGMIKEATVKLNGLTMIAGENDTGKSTVRKVLFAVVNYHQVVSDVYAEDVNFFTKQFKKQLHKELTC